MGQNILARWDKSQKKNTCNLPIQHVNIIWSTVSNWRRVCILSFLHLLGFLMFHIFIYTTPVLTIIVLLKFFWTNNINVFSNYEIFLWKCPSHYYSCPIIAKPHINIIIGVVYKQYVPWGYTCLLSTIDDALHRLDEMQWYNILWLHWHTAARLDSLSQGSLEISMLC